MQELLVIALPSLHTHVRLAHLKLGGHTVPQLPQAWELLVRLKQPLSHFSRPAAQSHVPLRHT